MSDLKKRYHTSILTCFCRVLQECYTDESFSIEVLP